MRSGEVRIEMLGKDYSAAPAASVAAHSSCPQLHAIEGCSADPSQYAPQYLLPSAGGQLQPGCAHLSLWFSVMTHLPALQIPLPRTGHNGFGVSRQHTPYARTHRRRKVTSFVDF